MKKLLLISLFIISFQSLHAADGTRFFWSFGDIGISFEDTNEYLRIHPSLTVGNINWITDSGLGWGFHAFNIESSTDWTKALILPVEINFSPFGDNSSRLFLTLYGRGGWMLNYDPHMSGSFRDRSSLFGAVGIRTAWIPNLGKHWSIFTGAFIEYTNQNELRMGISIDTSVLVALSTIFFGVVIYDDDDDDW